MPPNKNNYAIDILGAEMRLNPYATYKLLRNQDAVVKVGPYGQYAISRYRDVRKAFLTPEVFSSVGAHCIAAPLVPSREYLIVYQDGNEHKISRQYLSAKLFSELSRRHEVSINQLSKSLVDSIAPGKEIDAVSSIAQRFIVQCTNLVVGVNTHNFTNFNSWINQVENPPLSKNTSFDKAFNKNQNLLVKYLLSVVNANLSKSNLQPSILKSLLELKDRNSDIDIDTICELLEISILAGTQPVTHLISHALMQLSYNPQLTKTLIAKPEMTIHFTKELMRHSGPTHIQPRKTLKEYQLSGVTIPRNADVLLLMASANRDPLQFTNPNDFTLQRHNIKQQVGFGFGTHRCVGENYTIIKVSSLIRAVLSRFSRIECPKPEQLNWSFSYAAHGVQELPILFYK